MSARGRLRIEPTSLRHANGFVARYHRHHPPARGCIFCLSVVEGDRVRGVAIVGRPVGRMLQDGLTCEVTRLCTDGTPNVPSMLYGRVARIARLLGYLQIRTYTLPEEGGASLRAAGWVLEDEHAGGGAWSSLGRPRCDKHPTGEKWRWAARGGGRHG
jgi:hypothetical protein